MTVAARIGLNLDVEDKDLLSRAASLMGTTMAGFVRSAAKEKALTVLAQESHLLLSKRDFLAFNVAINSAFASNPALQDALKAASKVKSALMLVRTHFLLTQKSIRPRRFTNDMGLQPAPIRQ